MRSTTRRRANFVAENSTHLHQGLCFSTTPHCLARSATLNRQNTSLLHYGRWHPLVTLCNQIDKHATPRQAQDTTQTGCSLHWNRTQTKRSRGNQGHNADQILCLACGYMTRPQLTALESYINQTKCTASNSCTHAESIFFSSSSALSH